MKTIKVIDLLNKIANKEELPNYIEYSGYELTYDKYTQDYYNEPSCTYGLFDDIHLKLNDKVKIIEDTPKKDKKIEKIDLILDEHFTNDELQAYIYETQVKINEIIDRLNGEDNE